MAVRSQRGALDDSRPVWQTIGVFLIPLLLSNILQSNSATLNAIYLGRMIGTQALAAVSGFFPILFFLISFLIGLSSGSTVLIGQAFGARNEARMKEVAGTTLTLGFVLGIAVALFGYFTAPSILVAIGTPHEILAQTESYARITFIMIPVLFTFLVYSTFLRGTGDSITPFYFLIVSAACNALFTPILIGGWFGIPSQGVNSAALGPIGANLIALVSMVTYLNVRRHPLAFDREMMRNLRLRRPVVVQIVRIGVPTGVQLVMVSLSEIAVISFVNRFGATAVAAYGAVNQVVSYVQFPAISIGIAASIYGAQSIGAQRLDRLRKVVRATVTLNYLLGGALIVLAYALSEPLLALFLTDPKTHAVAHRLLNIILWSYAIFGNTAVLSGVMRSSGAVLWPTALQIFAIWGVEVPVAWYLSNRIGLDGVWIAYPIAYATALALQSGYYFVFWKKRKLVRLI